MSIFRIEKNTNYTVMSNYHLRDMNLSLKTKGLLSMILSLPDDWDYSLKGLTTICKDGRSAISAAIAELEKYGYLRRERERDESGRLGGMIYHIFETPVETESPKSGFPTQVKPRSENRTQENPTQENRTQLSKDILNKEKQNKDNTYLPTTRARAHAREDARSHDLTVADVERIIGRQLSINECLKFDEIIENNQDSELVKLAIEDNLFRNKLFKMKYVSETLDKWKRLGIQTPLEAKNYMLDEHADNVKAMASSLATNDYDQEEADRIISLNRTIDLQGTRDYMIELYREGRFEALLGLAASTYHEDVFDYLPSEIYEYIKQHQDKQEGSGS